ncbi:TolC family protein [Parabacteroides sp. OttesenSCG-928-G07]|nr:TolC family protein [Parabacteroides sp. OttesenSCG-928-G21]MDL2278400.1 TolC family protein [Parabacteroides sp. OttesenSCG-928-G07]
MKKIIYILSVVGLSTFVSAQTAQEVTSIQQVLQLIEANSKELQANNQLMTSQKLEAKAENNLPDPSVNYSHQYGNKSGMGFEGELEATQSFDFPTVYYQRNKLSKIKAENLDQQQAELRQQVLLNAKEICLDLILLKQQNQLLNDRLTNAERLSESYARRLETGDANILETNKIDLELLNVKTEVRRNNAAILQKQKELTALNGGEEINFTQSSYIDREEVPSFDELISEVQTYDPQLLVLKSEQSAAERNISVNKSQWLPELELGYRLNTATGGERFNGFIVGMSIPLFSNRHNVNKAKAEKLYSSLKYEDTYTKVENDLYQLYNQSMSLKESMNEYDKLLKNQNNISLLNRALEAGQISIIEYFVEVTSLYDSMENFMQVESDYQKAIAQLLKHRL